MAPQGSSGRRRSPGTLIVLIALLAATALSACGDDEDSGPSTEGASGGVTEMAFLTGMVPHHQSAIEMASVARDKASDHFVIELAGEIVEAQRAEIRQLRAIHRRLFDEPLVPDPAAHEGLNLTAAEAAMAHSPETMAELRSASPFDRAFIDEMVPHHQGAITMAEVVLGAAEDEELRALAEKIITEQRREIDEMNAFRSRKYGGPAPSALQGDEGEPRDDPAAHGGH